MRICVECKHHHPTDWEGLVWYGHFCGAVCYEPGRDPVTGKECWVSKTDLGALYFSDIKRPNCREINPHGECELWEGDDG